MPIEALQGAALIDHHCHGVVTADLDRPRFEALMSESFRPAPHGTSQFQKPLGLAIRRECAPVLDLEPLCPAQAYLDRRRALGAAEVNRRFLRASGLAALLIDTGHRSDEIAGCAEMAELAGCPAFEVVRIEAVAEEVARGGVSAQAYPQAFADRLAARAADAVGLKTIVAYRATFAIDQARPSRQAVTAAAGRWLVRSAGAEPRLDEVDVIRHGLWVAADLCRERGLPLQVHVGVGDPDIYMQACDPTRFTDFLRAMDEHGVAVTLLHNYPFQRQAAWLAEIFANVYYDVGFIMNFAAPGSDVILAEAMEMGPFFKQLYSSDAFGLAELYYLGQRSFRRALGRRLHAWLREGLCAQDDAEEIVALIAAGNARRIYGERIAAV